MRCLIVDDNEAFIEVARKFLEQDGLCVVGVASTAGDAFRQVEALRPDVILVDIFLGAESGLALATRLGAMDGEPAVILISTHGEGDVSALISGSGVAGFLPKAELSAEAVRSIVDGRTR